MKRALPLLLIFVLHGAAPAYAVAGFGLENPRGSRPPAPIIVESPPLFLVPPSLGFPVAVGTPYALYYLDGRYYCHRWRSWYVAPAYGGPWAVIARNRLPPGLRRRDARAMAELRDAEYRDYLVQKERYRGKAFRPLPAGGGDFGWLEASSGPVKGSHAD